MATTDVRALDANEIQGAALPEGGFLDGGAVYLDAAHARHLFAREYANWIDPIPENEDSLRSLMQAAPDGYPSSWYRSELRVGRLRNAFGRLRAASDVGGFRVAVLVVPWLDEFDPYRHTTAHRIVEHEALRASFDTIDALPLFLAGHPLLLRVDVSDPLHPNEQGHVLLAEAALAYLRDATPDLFPNPASAD